MSVPAVFDYHPAKTIEEAIALLQQYGDDAKVLSGGHSLIPAMKLRLSQPGHLVDIGRVDGLSYVREEGNAVVVGALTTYTTMAGSDLLAHHFAAIPEAINLIADQQVRNRGTIGGCLAHADPAGDLPAVVLALKAEIVAQGPKGTRTVPIDDFLVSTFTTALEPDEIVTAVRFPLPPAKTGSAYEKLANRASHYAVVGCAAVVTLGGDGTCTSASVAISGAATEIARADAVEAALVGKKLDEATIAEAATHAPEGLELISDIHGSEAYRRQMSSVIARRAITRALERAS
jgi:carbon-monoxide dehydrogenase medium subunit